MTYNNGWEPQEPPPTRITAGYTASGITDGVVVPVLKSLFIGFTTGVLAGLLAHVLRWPPGVSPWIVWLITTFAVTSWAFWRYSERGQWLIERITGADLNGDSFIGQPQAPMLPAPAEPMRVIVSQDQGRSVDYIDLPPGIDAEKMRLLARGVLGGRQFALSVWAGPHQVFSRSEFEALRSVLIERGLATWRNPGSPNQGITLTGPGRAVFRRFAGDEPPPQERGG